MPHYVLTHPQHGRHDCYDVQELEYLTKQRGFKLEGEVKPGGPKPWKKTEEPAKKAK